MFYDAIGTDWKTWVGVGLCTIAIGIAIIAAVPTGGGSLALAGMGLEAAAGVAIGEAAITAGTIVTGTALVQEALTNVSFFSNKYEDGSKSLKNGIDVHYEYNGNGSGNVHIHTKLPGLEKVVVWKIENGIRAVLTVNKIIKEIIRQPIVKRVITEFIRQVRNLAE